MPLPSDSVTAAALKLRNPKLYQQLLEESQGLVESGEGKVEPTESNYTQGFEKRFTPEQRLRQQAQKEALIRALQKRDNQ